MGAILGDLIQCIDNQTYLGQQVLNVYYYRIILALGMDDPYMNLLNGWFTDNVLSVVTGLQVNSLSHVSREWRNLSNGVDLYTDNTLVSGDIAAAASALLPSYVSAGFLLQRESLATRNGYKRLAGISETNVQGNDLVGATASVAAIEEAFAADIVISVVPTAEPVIVRRPINPPVASYVYSSIGSASFRTVGTQNSRKAGRGV